MSESGECDFCQEDAVVMLNDEFGQEFHFCESHALECSCVTCQCTFKPEDYEFVALEHDYDIVCKTCKEKFHKCIACGGVFNPDEDLDRDVTDDGVACGNCVENQTISNAYSGCGGEF